MTYAVLNVIQFLLAVVNSGLSSMVLITMLNVVHLVYAVLTVA